MKRQLIAIIFGIMIISVTLVAIASDDPGAAPPSEALFELVERESAPEIQDSVVTQSEFITIDTAKLNQGQERLVLPTLDGATAEAVLSDFENRGLHQTTWRGWIGGEGRHRAVFSLHEGHVAGIFYTDDGAYEILPTRRGQVINRTDHRLAASCAEGVYDIPGLAPPPVEPPHDQDDGGGKRAAASPPTPDLVSSDAGARKVESVKGDASYDIHILTVYTPDARDGAGSVGAIEATIRAAVDITNTAFMDSDMDARFRLVHTEIAPDGYNDSGDIGNDLAWMDGSAALATLRTTHLADMVSLVTENGGGYCGLAHVQRTLGVVTPYQVTDRGCTVGNLSWAHEHGHNMGFEHDPANGAAPGDALTTFAFAHFVDGNFRTVMSYSSECTMGCTRVPHFSNPDISHNGESTGIASQRDNAATGDWSDWTCAQFQTGSGVTGKTVAQYISSVRTWNHADMSDIKGYMEFAGHNVTADGYISGGVLDGADVLVVGEPTAAPSGMWADELSDWVHDGGTLLMLVDTSTDETIANEYLVAVGSEVRVSAMTTTSIGPFPFIPDFVEGPPYNVANQTASNTLGHAVTGGIELAGLLGRFEYLGAGGVIVIGDRIDHNTFITDPTHSWADDLHAQFFLNIAENGIQSSKHTTMLGTNGNKAITFDLYNQTDTARMLTGFGVNLRHSTPGSTETVTVYYRQGTANGHQSDASDWILLGSDTSVLHAGDDLSRVNVGGLVLEPYTTYGFQMVCPGIGVDYSDSGTTATPVTYAFGDLELTSYHGLSGAFSTNIFIYREFNGAVYYTTVPWNTTHFDAGNGLAGNMFDIDVHDQPVMIQGFNVHLNQAGETAIIKAYYRPGTAVGFSGSSSGWVFMDSDFVVSNGAGIPTPVNISGPIFDRNSSYGIYVAIDPYDSAPMMQYTNGGPTAFAGDDLSITTLYGKGDPLFTGLTFSYREFNGTMFYSVVTNIFRDNFESGNTSAWTSTTP